MLMVSHIGLCYTLHNMVTLCLFSRYSHRLIPCITYMIVVTLCLWFLHSHIGLCYTLHDMVTLCLFLRYSHRLIPCIPYMKVVTFCSFLLYLTLEKYAPQDMSANEMFATRLLFPQKTQKEMSATKYARENCKNKRYVTFFVNDHQL